MVKRVIFYCRNKWKNTLYTTQTALKRRTDPPISLLMDRHKKRAARAGQPFEKYAMGKSRVMDFGLPVSALG